MFNKCKLKIGFDFDGTIIDHTQNKILIARQYGFEIQSAQTPSRRLKKIVSEPVYRQIQNEIYGSLTLSAPIMDGAISALEELNKIAELFLISRRQSPEFRLVAKKWLADNLSHIFSETAIFFVDTNQDKNNFCRDLKINIYIDDNLSVLEYLNDVLYRHWFDQYDLSGEVDHQGTIVVKSWEDFLNKIKRLSIAQP